jgi:hypothetical protein
MGVIKYRLKHLFYFANFTLATLLICLPIKNFQKYGVNIVLSLLACLFYFLTYKSLKKSAYSEKGLLNMLGFAITVSFLLALSNCLLVITSFTLFEYLENFSSESIHFLSFGFHGLLFSCAILLLVFYNDFYYVFIILLFQIGVVITNKDKYSTGDKFTLIYMILTAISFIFSIFCGKKPTHEEDKEDLVANYHEEKIKAQVI